MSRRKAATSRPKGTAAATPAGSRSTAPAAGTAETVAPVPVAPVPGSQVPGSQVPGAETTDAVPAGWVRPLDIAITVVGLIVATGLGAALAIIEAFFAPLRLTDPSIRLPVSLVLALVTNPLLVWFAFTVSGRRLTALLPAGAWCVVWVLAADRTTEGDVMITDTNWVSLLTLFTGPLAFAVTIYRSTLRQQVIKNPSGKIQSAKPATPLASRSVER